MDSTELNVSLLFLYMPGLLKAILLEVCLAALLREKLLVKGFLVIVWREFLLCVSKFRFLYSFEPSSETSRTCYFFLCFRIIGEEIASCNCCLLKPALVVFEVISELRVNLI